MANMPSRNPATAHRLKCLCFPHAIAPVTIPIAELMINAVTRYPMVPLPIACPIPLRVRTYSQPARRRAGRAGHPDGTATTPRRLVHTFAAPPLAWPPSSSAAALYGLLAASWRPPGGRPGVTVATRRGGLPAVRVTAAGDVGGLVHDAAAELAELVRVMASQSQQRL